MASLQKRRKNYYSKIQVRVSKDKRKSVYVNLLTTTYSKAKVRHHDVDAQEQKIRKEMRMGEATKSDLLNINNKKDWMWIKQDGTPTSDKYYTLSEYVDKFLQYKKNKRMAKATLESYNFGLNKLLDAVNPSMLMEELTDSHIDDLVALLSSQNLSESSMDSYLRCVSSFLKWCKRRGYHDQIPIVELFNPIVADKWLTEAEYDAVLSYDSYKTHMGSVCLNSVNLPPTRFRKVFKLYGETGLRLQEGFYGVLTEDSNGIWLAIPDEKSKSKKGRTISLNTEQRDTIQMMQRIWYEQGATIDHIKYYSRKFKNVCRALGVAENKSFHSLRHYYGKTQVTITGNIYQVSGLMGHSSIKVTEDYYVKGFDMKATLRDFPSLKKYLITPKNEQNMGVEPPEWSHQYAYLEDSSSRN